MTLLALARLAWADPARGEVMVVAEDSARCTLSVDGAAMGALPLHLASFAGGPHRFTVTCPDGRTATTEQVVTLVPGGLARVELVGLDYGAARPEVVSGPVPTYVLLSRIGGEKVAIDGGPPVTLPAKVELTTGPHRFVVIEPSGAARPPVTRDVVSKDGQAVVKLD